MKVELLDNAKKKKIIEKLNYEYGIEKLPYLLIRSGKDKIRIYSGNFSKEELNELGKGLNVELLGISFLRPDQETYRISFDTINIPQIKNQITKNIIEIPDNQITEWFKGNSLENTKKIDLNSKFVVIKNNNDLLGVAKGNQDTIFNYVPKERRVRTN